MHQSRTAVPAPRTLTDPVEMARRHFHLIDAGDPHAMTELFEPDAVYLRPGYEPFVGQAGILRFYTKIRTIREGNHSLDTVTAVDGQVAVRGGFTGWSFGGDRIDLRFSDFFTIGATGRFSQRETFFFAPLV